MCLPPPFILGCAAVETSSPGQRQRGLLPGLSAAYTEACRALGAAVQIQGPWGLGGALGLWSPGPLRMVGVRFPSSRTHGL